MDYWEQKTAQMYRIAFLIITSFALFGCKQQTKTNIQLPYYNEPTFTPMFFDNKIDAKKNITHSIGNFTFLNQDSVKVDQTFIENKIHVASFIFTSCGSICPIMIKHLKVLNNAFINQNNVVLLSYSVTPWIDTPIVLKNYKSNQGIQNKNWHFLTGSKNKIYTLARQSYFAEEDLGFTKDNTEFLHTEHIVLVDASKKIRGIYNGTLLLDIEQLIKDIKTLQNEYK